MTAAAFELFVNGTRCVRGLALAQPAGAEFLGAARTAPIYRLYSIDDRHPGMFEVAEGGVAVAGEVYRVPDEVWRRVEAGEPPNLYCGPVRSMDGRVIRGILYPREPAEGRQRDISEFADWRAYMAARAQEAQGDHAVPGGTLPGAGVRSGLHGALLIIDMQRDFVEPGGFGEMLGNDVSLLRSAIAPCQRVLAAARDGPAGASHPRGAPPRRRRAAVQAAAAAARGRHRRPCSMAGSWCAASTATTSSPSSIRSPASR